MGRLRDLASRSKRSNAFPSSSPFAFTLPAAVSRRDLFEATSDNNLAHRQALSSVPHLPPFAGPSLNQVDAATQTDSKVEPSSPTNGSMHGNLEGAHMANNANMANTTRDINKLVDMRAKKGAASTTNKWRETQHHLLAMADILTAHGDVLAHSGQNLSHTLNDIARDILEMNGIISRRGKEIEELDAQLRSMQRRFNTAHAQLKKAQDLTGRIIDDSTVQIHRRQTLTTMQQALQGINRVMGHEDLSKWDQEKVNGVLAKLDGIYQRNESLYQFKVVRWGVATLARLFKDTECNTRFHYLLALSTGPDKLETLDEYREEDRDDRDMATKSVYVGPRPSPPSMPVVASTSTVATRVYRHPYTYTNTNTNTNANTNTKIDTHNQPNPSPRCKIVTMKYRKSKLTAAQKKLMVRMPSSPVPKTPGGVETPMSSFSPLPSYPTHCDCIACRLSAWTVAQPDQNPEALKEAFISTLGGTESVRQDLAEAIRAISGDFRSGILHTLQSGGLDNNKKPSLFVAPAKLKEAGRLFGWSDEELQSVSKLLRRGVCTAHSPK